MDVPRNIRNIHKTEELIFCDCKFEAINNFTCCLFFAPAADPQTITDHKNVALARVTIIMKNKFKFFLTYLQKYFWPILILCGIWGKRRRK